MGFENSKGYLTDIGGSQISNLSIFEIEVERNVKITDQPIESGESRQDSKVREPITVTLTCGCKSPYWDEVRPKLAELFKEKTKKTCSVCTKVEVLKNMALVSFPYTVSPDNYDVLMFNLTLQEVIVVGEQSVNDFSNAASSENSSTVSSSANASGESVNQDVQNRKLAEQNVRLLDENHTLKQQIAAKDNK